MPELLWKAYIDFEVEEGERARGRALYERLTSTSGHWKVWVAYAMFEAQPIQPPRDEREEDEEEGDEGDEEREGKRNRWAASVCTFVRSLARWLVPW